MAERRQLDGFFKKYDRIFVFDTETTGLHAERDQIIEFAGVGVDMRFGYPEIFGEYDSLISLEPGTTVPDEITRLTGITELDLIYNGIPKEKLCEDFAAMITPNTLLVAYNAHFDLTFLYYTLAKYGDPTLLQGKDKLDLLTVYKDRHSYPHRLENAIATYNLAGQVQNSHRAIDDVRATVAVMMRMDYERSDLLSYINLFGYNPKYGPPRNPIKSVTYKRQYFDPWYPLYQTYD